MCGIWLKRFPVSAWSPPWHCGWACACACAWHCTSSPPWHWLCFLSIQTSLRLTGAAINDLLRPPINAHLLKYFYKYYQLAWSLWVTNFFTSLGNISQNQIFYRKTAWHQYGHSCKHSRRTLAASLDYYRLGCVVNRSKITTTHEHYIHLLLSDQDTNYKHSLNKISHCYKRREGEDNGEMSVNLWQKPIDGSWVHFWGTLSVSSSLEDKWRVGVIKHQVSSVEKGSFNGYQCEDNRHIQTYLDIFRKEKWR